MVIQIHRKALSMLCVCASTDKLSFLLEPTGSAKIWEVTLSKLKRTLPQPKIHVTSKSPVGDISVVTLIRTDTTLDHSQKAEKVCLSPSSSGHANK